MIKDSKILTVSYGTFSCTLEGFDDSFTTMKAIAEYFRDLAADDRYFGAEPPTPDAEMLARIAEREIERRVQAHNDDGKIVLRAEQAAPTALLADQESAPETVEPETGEVEISPVSDAPLTADALEADAIEAEIADSESLDHSEIDQPDTAEMSEDEDEAEPAPAVSRSQGFTAPMPARAIKEAALESADGSEPTNTADESDITDAQAEGIAADDTQQDFVSDASVDLADAEADLVEITDEIEEITADEQTDTLADFAEQEEDITSEADIATDVTADQDADDISHPDPDSVAAKLSRIRSVVAQSEQPYADTAYSEDEHAAGFLETNLADLDAALAADDAAELRASDETEEEIETDTAETETQGDAQDDETSILANISAVTEDSPATSEAATSEVEEDAKAAPLELSEADLAQTDADDAIEDTLAQLMADAMPEGGPATALDDEEDDDLDVAEEQARPLNARVVKMKTADVEAALAAGQLLAADEGQDTVNLFTDEDGTEIESTLSPEEEAELQRELAEVEADFAPDMAAETAEADDVADVISDVLDLDAEDAEDDDSEYDDVEILTGSGDDLADDFVEAEPEIEAEFKADDLMDAEDAADESEDLDFPADEDDLEEALNDASTGSARGVDRLQAVEQTSDVSRIFDEVDQQRDDPGSSERRNAIQHLRAAVAATRADQNAGVDISKDKDDSAYRSDLADVVRPRRPRPAGASRSERPGMDRPAPLKLVAEQRVDMHQEPIRPRRITASDMADMAAAEGADADGNFADFAEEMGAGSLPDLLEAAAAYMADVEGRPQFSRPMLMGKLKEVEGDAFSREDGLRSFGQLLRQGKLQKLKGGRFAVTEETEFRARA